MNALKRWWLSLQASPTSGSSTQELRQGIERLKDDELMCLSCRNVQKKGAWEKKKDAEAKAAGYGGFSLINEKPRCLKCDSNDMAGPKWDGYLLKQDKIAYYNKLKELGVNVAWMRGHE